MLDVSINEAQAVFDEHLMADEWEQASTSLKERALAHACRDISSLNYSSTIPRQKLVAAVCEQALFLMSLTATDKERLKAQKLGVGERSVEGASERYFDKTLGKAFSPDALVLLEGYVHRRVGHMR